MIRARRRAVSSTHITRSRVQNSPHSDMRYMLPGPRVRNALGRFGVLKIRTSEPQNGEFVVRSSCTSGNRNTVNRAKKGRRLLTG